MRDGFREWVDEGYKDVVWEHQSYLFISVTLAMQLTIRGQESYLLDFNGDETFAELKNRVCEQEKTEVLLYVSGKPLPEEGVVSSIENCAVDVTVPLLGGKVIVPKY